MSTIILNGSPKGSSSQCNSRIISEAFVSGMKKPCEIKCIANSDLKELAQYVKNFDTIIFVLPLYIHAMPGITMKFIEQLEPAASNGKYIGFIIQAGFIESAQERFVERYFADLAKQLNYNYLGSVSKGECAGIYMFPDMYKKILKLYTDLGIGYEETHCFDMDIVKKLNHPYELSKFNLILLNFATKIGLTNIFWDSTLKKNNVFDKRFDKPFL